MKAPSHSLNATEVTTCRSGVETSHENANNGLISYSGQIVKQNLLFFVIQDC